MSAASRKPGFNVYPDGVNDLDDRTKRSERLRQRLIADGGTVSDDGLGIRAA
jgi:hypothetical protein